MIGKFSEAQIEAEWKAVEGSKYFESPLLYKENGFKEEKDALALMEELNGQKAIVKSIEKDNIKKKEHHFFLILRNFRQNVRKIQDKSG